MKIKLLLFMTFFMSISMMYSQADPNIVKLFKDADLGGESSEMIKVYYPQGKHEKLPVLVFLHGAGERGNDNEFQLLHIAPILVNEYNLANYPAILVFPQCEEDDYWAPVERGDWIPKEGAKVTPAMSHVIAALDNLRKRPEVDPSRIYIAGLSMGGFGTFDILSRYPEWFAGAIAICGGGNLDAAEKFKDVPLWIFHGAADSVVKPELSRSMHHRLSSMGANVRYTEYPDGGHNVWDQAFEDPRTLKWLFTQVKE